MKFQKEFESIEKKETIIKVPGWTKELKILYGYYFLTDKNVFILWKIENTDKIFNEDIRIVNQHFGPKYEEYFQAVLIDFRKDILKWIKEGLQQEWQINCFMK